MGPGQFCCTRVRSEWKATDSQLRSSLEKGSTCSAGNWEEVSLAGHGGLALSEALGDLVTTHFLTRCLFLRFLHHPAPPKRGA